MSYINSYSLEAKNSIDFFNDAQVLWGYAFGGNGSQPPIIEKKYENFYEFILINGTKKILILENILNETHINNITNNDKSLIKYAYISNNCVSIESNCFKDCSNLELISYTNIDNVDNVDICLNNIGSSAFENCNKLEDFGLFDISNSIQTIGNNALKIVVIYMKLL